MKYIAELKGAILRLHGCASVFVRSEPVKEVFQGQTVWDGTVGIFDLKNCAQAKQCFAWSHLDGENDKGRRFVAVLAVPPINTPRDAVKAAIVQEIREKVKNENRTAH